MSKRKPKTEKKPITAQAIGDPFCVQTGPSLKPFTGSKQHPRGESGHTQYAEGCYRRVPRFFN